MSRLLIHDYPLMVSPRLATAIGLNEAIFLQQLHYWLGTSGKERKGRRWVYNTLTEWNAQFPFWGLRTVRRTIDSLELNGLVDSTDEFNVIKSDRTKWYTINYARLDALDVGLPKTADHVDKVAMPSGQNGQLLASGQNGQLLPEKKITSETKKPPQPPKGEGVDLPEWINDEQWAEFIEHRKSLRKPLTPLAARKTIAELTKLKASGQDPSQVLDQSMVQGWAGVFPIREGSGAARAAQGTARGGEAAMNPYAIKVETNTEEVDW